jgi:ABC-type lipoprotein release transport system permease subunit
MFFLLAWRNLWRNRNRSLITIAAVWCAVLLSILMSSLQKGALDNMVDNVVSFYTGYIQVHHEGYWNEQTLDNCFILPDSTLKKVASRPEVRSVTPRLQSFSLVSTGEKTKGCMVSGISPAQEDLVTRLKSKITTGAYLTDSSRQLLVAEGLANNLQCKAGDTLVLLGQGYYGSTAAGKYVVAGLLHFGSPELNDRLVYMSIQLAREWLDAPGLTSALVISPTGPDASEAAAQQVRSVLPAGYEVMTWTDMMPDIKETLQSKSAGANIILGILYLLISFGIFATLLMMMAERKREFGMLIALGVKKRQLAGVVLMESVLITITGCLVGIAMSIPIVWYLHVHPIRIGGETAKVYAKFGFESVFPTSTDPAIFWKQAVIVLCIGLLLSIYPVIKTLTIKPVEAMRA